MRPTRREAAIGVVFHAAEESASVPARAVKRSRDHAGLVFVTEPEEAVIVIGVLLIDADIKIVPALLPHRIGQEVEPVAVNIGAGIQLGKSSGQWIGRRNGIVCKRHTAQARRVARIIGEACLPRVEDLTSEGGIAAAIQRRGGDVRVWIRKENLCGGIQLRQEIPVALIVGRHG